jgi:multicomponent Na+:H+ antiporter subunit D
LFGGLLTKVGIYAMWRVVVMIFPNDLAYLQPLILAIAALTMITGVIGAVAQTDFRRLLSFHIVSQIGYLIMGIGIGTPLAIAGAIFFTVHVILAKTTLFFVSGVVHELKGTYTLKKLGGMVKSHRGIAALFFLAAMSLAGIPPFSGFWAKLILLRAGLAEGHYVVTAVALGVSLLTLYSMVKIWNEVFWKKAAEKATDESLETHKRGAATPFELRVMIGVTAVMTAVVVLVGVVAEPLLVVSQQASDGLLNPTTYVETILTPETDNTVTEGGE